MATVSIAAWDPARIYGIYESVYFEGKIYFAKIDRLENVIPYDTDSWVAQTYINNGSVWPIPSYWDYATTYAAVDNVFYKGTIFQSIQNGNIGNAPEPSPWWTRIGDYAEDVGFNISFIWHEGKNRFTEFLTPTPKLYVQSPNNYYSFSPRINANGTLPKPYMFREQSSGYLCWYNRNMTGDEPIEDFPLTAKGYIKLVKNASRQIIKQFTNIFAQYKQVGDFQVPENTAPYMVIVETNSGATGRQKTTVSRDDWEYDDIALLLFSSVIKNDEITSVDGDNPNGDTSEMYGTYCTLMFIFNDGDSVFSFEDGKIVQQSSAGRLSSLTTKVLFSYPITV